MIVSSILSFVNPKEDEALKNWKWSTQDKDKTVNAMAAYTAPADQPKAYTTLAAYTFNGKPLPMKVAAGVALSYIAKIS